MTKAVQGGPTPNAEATAPQSKKVRLSADIDPDLYRELASWCHDVALQLGRTRVQHVWAIRALINELLEDRELEVRIIERIQEDLEV
jgi:hypothetical protein